MCMELTEASLNTNETELRTYIVVKALNKVALGSYSTGCGQFCAFIDVIFEMSSGYLIYYLSDQQTNYNTPAAKDATLTGWEN